MLARLRVQADPQPMRNEHSTAIDHLYRLLATPTVEDGCTLEQLVSLSRLSLSEVLCLVPVGMALYGASDGRRCLAVGFGCDIGMRFDDAVSMLEYPFDHRIYLDTLVLMAMRESRRLARFGNEAPLVEAAAAMAAAGWARMASGNAPKRLSVDGDTRV